MEDKVARSALIHLLASLESEGSLSPKRVQEVIEKLNEQ